MAALQRAAFKGYQMEHLIHYTWKHKIFPLHELRSTDGQTVEVLNPGLANTNDGPDFIGASIKIGGTLWAGNVEIHTRSSDWFRHHHDHDSNYSNVILHVASIIDCQVFYPDGRAIPQLQLDVPQYVADNYAALIQRDALPRCKDVLATLPAICIHNWMTSLTLERFTLRATQIMERRESLNKSWEDTLFVTIARNFGFGINGNAFEQWAQSIPMASAGKHRDSLFQIEAIFFGQAGLLLDGMHDEYSLALQKEYRYLQQKFSLTPINPKAWKFLRLRPQNFPHVRIAQLASIYHMQRLSMSSLLDASSPEDIAELLSTDVSDYWRTHYTFGPQASTPSARNMSASSISLIAINSVAPMLFAYGRYKCDQDLCERAIDIWQRIKPENNSIIRRWKEAGIACANAADSQALMQQTLHYCQSRDCLRCTFGYEYIKRTPDLLRESGEDSTW